MRKISINSEIAKIAGIEFDKDGVPELSSHNIELVHNYVIDQSSYSADSGDNFVRKYFQDENNNPQDKSTIITRIILIDTVDSTNLKRLLGKDYYKIMADKILDTEIESKIEKGCPINEEFKKIAQCSPRKNSNKADMNLFIFVSKYVTRVNQYCYNGNDYSIMDGVVKDNLPYYNGKNGLDIPNLEKFRNEYDYDRYCEMIKRLLEKLNRNSNFEITRDMLDHFVWFTFKKEAVGDK